MMRAKEENCEDERWIFDKMVKWKRGCAKERGGCYCLCIYYLARYPAAIRTVLVELPSSQIPQRLVVSAN